MARSWTFTYQPVISHKDVSCIDGSLVKRVKLVDDKGRNVLANWLYDGTVCEKQLYREKGRSRLLDYSLFMNIHQ